MVEIYIYNQMYEVPEGLTILQAFEWAGFHLTRGVGCRGGFCGACSTVYRIAGDHRLHYALACQTVVEPGMILGPIPFFPAQRPAYFLEELAARRVYPTGSIPRNPALLRLQYLHQSLPAGDRCPELYVGSHPWRYTVAGRYLL